MKQKKELERGGVRKFLAEHDEVVDPSARQADPLTPSSGLTPGHSITLSRDGWEGLPAFTLTKRKFLFYTEEAS